MSFTIAEIEKKTKSYSEIHEQISSEVRYMQKQMEETKRLAMHHIRRLLESACERKAEVAGMVEASPELFEKPRTLVFYGIKIGFQKGKGKIVIDDPEKTIKKIKEHLSVLIPTLIETKEVPRKSAIEQLDVADLKMIGCKVEGTGDTVIVKPVDGEVDKMIAALMKDEE
jgi:hypothetical protein